MKGSEGTPFVSMKRPLVLVRDQGLHQRFSIFTDMSRQHRGRIYRRENGVRRSVVLCM